MEFEERKKVISFLKSIEESFPVNEWKYEDVSLWPLVKSISFFTKNTSVKKEPNFFFVLLKKIQKILDLIFGLINISFKIMFFKKNKKTNLFLSEKHFRVKLKSKSFNKYFDPMMDYLEEEGLNDSALLELSKIKEKDTFYRKDRLLDIKEYYPYFKLKHKKVIIDFKKLKEFETVIKQISETINIPSKEIKKRIENHLNDILIWEKLADFIYQKMEPKNVFILCYYTIPAYGFILSAKKNKITTIDVQHGGQGSFHSFYNFTNIPKEGFSILPDFFMNWDKSSFNVLDTAFSNTESHKAIVSGNIWSDYLSEFSFDFNTEKKIIFYSMQTESIPVLHDYIIEAIKTSTEDYIWWLRLHPRMTRIEIDELLNSIEEHQIKNKVRLDYGKNTPLPLILMNCFAHISHFSGCIIEAALLNVERNIVLGEIGLKFYSELIENKEAFYIDVKKNNLFLDIVNIAINKPDITNTNSDVCYKKIIKEIFINN
jgi:hypothetical protein